jgi:hypothetical protein
MRLQNHITIKVVSQMEHLVYEGVRQKKQASVSKMNMLLGINSPQTHAEESKVKTSDSYELYSAALTANEEVGDAGIPSKALTLCTEETLGKFATFGDIAASKRKQFFKEVEEGKNRLLTKYGEHKAIPKEEVAALAKELRPYGCTIWKHQICVTRTQAEPFEGARLTKDNRYTATVKSKTIYTMAPLTDSQLEELKKVLLGELKPSSTGSVAQRFTENGYVALWRNPETGKVVMTEDVSQFS